jgi:peptidoglycan-N-acetylglucosamine deacetylase
VFRRVLNERIRKSVGAITHVSTDERIAALTFDDGPHPVYTPRLLDVLDRFQARATFFMVGEAAHAHPDLVRTVASTHAIGNHSWDHPVFSEITGRDRRRQLRLCADAIAPYGRKLFRPPYGEQSGGSRLDAWLLGYRSVGWNVHAEDWLPREPDWMAERLLRHTGPGSIVLLHDAIFRSRQPIPQYDRGPMIEAVEMFLERLGGRLRLVTVPELLRRGRATDASRK